MFGARIDNDVFKDLKHLSVDKERPAGELVEEAIRDLLKKYKGKPTGSSHPKMDG